LKRATPNLDALAQRGVLFRNAYTNNPICCSARASMWSGLYTFRCEGWNNYKGLNREDPTFQTRLEEVGYRVQTFGKTDYLSGEHSVRARVSACTRSAGIQLPNYNESAPVVLPGDKRDVHDKDWQLIRQGVAWLKEARKSPDKPFLLYLGLGIPHPAFRTSQHYYDKIPEAAVTLPPDDQYDHPVMRYQRAVKAWKHGFSPEMVRKVRRTYFAMIAEFDAMLGELLASLDEPGLRENTSVIVTSDHGENAMEHQQWYKMNVYESSAGIPLLVAGPGFQQNLAVESTASRRIPPRRRWQPPPAKATWERDRWPRQALSAVASESAPMSRKSLVSRRLSPIPPRRNSSPTIREARASGRSRAFCFACGASSPPCLPANGFLSWAAPFRQNGRAADNGRHPSS
jgi:arylsulfatase K